MGIINQQSVEDSRKVLTGTDACLLNANGKILARIETYTAQVNVNVASYQPIGDPQQHDVPTGYKTTLSFTELMVEDDEFINDLFAYINDNKRPEWNFQGVVKGQNGGEQRYIYNYCVPSGTIDLQNIVVGEVLKRQWNLTVNGQVRQQGKLKQ